MFGKSSKTQARREGSVPELRLVFADLIRPLAVRGRRLHRHGPKPVPGPWDPGYDPADRHSARLALAA